MNKRIKRRKFLEFLTVRGLTAYQLAKELNYKPQAVYNWLYGKGTPSPSIMLIFVERFEIEAKDVLLMFAE